MERIRMKRRRHGFAWFLAVALVSGGIAAAANPRPPSIGGKETVATVNGEPISREQFLRALDSLHQGAAEKETGHRRNLSALLQRLVNARLILQEAHNIGLDDLTEVKENLEAFRQQALRGGLLSRQVQGVRPDDKKVEKVYRESIRELKIRSVLFEKEEDAKRAEEEIRSGADFDNVMRRSVSEGKARGGEEGSFVKAKNLLPEILEAVSKMKDGDTSAVLKVAAEKKGETAFTILRLEGVRFPEDPAAREEAKSAVLKEQRLAAINKYTESLKKRDVKIHKETLDALDYESKDPGLDNLLKDSRVVAEIRGEKPIRVSDLSLALQQKFYHGVERAAEGKKVNKEKQEILNEMVLTRVLGKEALRKKIDRTPEYKTRFGEYRDEVLFGTFVQKVIYPGIKADDATDRKYYEEHGKNFVSPESMRIDDLAFGKREDAVDALEKLRGRAEFKWVKANAPGQIEGKSRQGVEPFGGQLHVVQNLPDGVPEAISGAGPENFRLYASPGGQFFVLYVQEVFPAKPVPFEDAKGWIREKVIQAELQKSVEEWVAKLRAASDIRIYLTEEEMEKIFVPSGGGAPKR
jgi:parvulin-like peptidyl-prolyl isomerase